MRSDWGHADPSCRRRCHRPARPDGHRLQPGTGPGSRPAVDPGAGSRRTPGPGAARPAGRHEVTGDGVFAHLQELQRIADANGGNRALGTPGYDASVDYVAGVLRARATRWRPRSSPPAGSPCGDQTADRGRRAPVPASRPGLLPRHPGGRGHRAAGRGGRARAATPPRLAGVPAGSVVLVRRGTCTFAQKSAVAATAGAAAVLVVNNADGPAVGRHPRRRRRPGSCPPAGSRRPTATRCSPAAAASVSLVLATHGRRRPQPQRDRPDHAPATPTRWCSRGAHLDSVPGRARASTTTAPGRPPLLEIAVRLGGAPPVANAVRFAFWGAEEEGLIGSTAYVQGLTPRRDRDRIALYLNLDMVGSPNSGYSSTTATTPTAKAAGPGPTGSATHRAGAGRGARPRPGCSRAAPTSTAARTTGRSSQAGIPSGGLFTGADGADDAGGRRSCGAATPNAAARPCYHQACDRLDTIDRVALDRNSTPSPPRSPASPCPPRDSAG